MITAKPTTKPTKPPAPAESGVVDVCLGALAGVGFFSFCAGLFSLLFGTSAIHQILTACYFLIFVVCVAGVAIVNAVRGAAKTIRLP